MRKVIRDRWDDGYQVTKLEYGEGRWFALFDKNIRWSEEAYSSTYGWERFRLTLKKYWKKDFDIIGIASGWND